MIRFRYFGDSEKAKELVHFGRKQMNILREQLSLSTIWTDVRRFFDKRSGVEIICSIVSGMEQVDIYVPLRVVSVSVVKEEYTYSPYLILAIGNYIGAEGAYSLSNFSAFYFSVWDIENEEVVVAPGGDADAYFAEGNFDEDSSSGTFFKAICYDGTPNSTISLAQINAEKITTVGVSCHLDIPQLSGNVSCSDSNINVFGDTDTCSMSYDKAIDFGEYTTTNQNKFTVHAGYYRMVSPVSITAFMIGTEYYNTVLPGQSLLLADTGAYKVGVDYTYDDYYDYGTTSAISSIVKNITIVSPLGELFLAEPIDSTVCNRNLYSGHYQDVYSTSSVCKSMYLDSPNLGSSSARAAFYFAQYNTYEGDIQDSFYCKDYENLMRDGFEYAPDIISIGDRKYDIIAGVDRGNITDGFSIEQSIGLTKAFKDLVNYYHTHTFYNGLPLESNYINTRLDIDATLISWKAPQ